MICKGIGSEKPFTFALPPKAFIISYMRLVYMIPVCNIFHLCVRDWFHHCAIKVNVTLEE